jgi:CRP-like cAMP-binding protein
MGKYLWKNYFKHTTKEKEINAILKENILFQDLTKKHQKGKNRAEIVITKLSPGDFFGELSLVEEGGRRSATATAKNETTLIGFFKPDLLEILERNPNAGVKIALRLGEVLGCRLRETNDRVSVLEDQLKQLRSAGES